MMSPVPSEDGVSYLWMAQQFAAGQWADALSMVFPPGYPLLVAPFVALGLDAERAAVLVNAMAFGATAWPLARIARELSPNVLAVEVSPCVLFLTGSLLARVAAEVYSEPLFLLLMAWGTAFGLRGRFWSMGILAGLAFWIRPEGLLLAASFALARPRTAWRAVLPTAAAVLLLAVLRFCVGHGFDPLPILEFHQQRDDLAQRGAMFGNLLEVPGAWLEAFGIAGVVLVCWLVPRMRRTLPRAPALWWQIALQILVVCTFVVRRRFFLSCAVAVIALAGTAIERLPRWGRRVVLIAAVLMGVFGSIFGGILPDRLAERLIADHLAERLVGDQRIAGDLTRVLWFAGQRPLPPRHFDTEQLVEMAAPENVRYFVFSERSRRESSQQIEAALAGTFERLQLPDELASSCRARGIAVLARR